MLLVDGRIGRVGRVSREALERTGLELEVIDASGCVAAPGIIDPHQHLLGGSGEQGFHTQSGGRRLMRDGRVAVTEGCLEQSDREVTLVGRKPGETG